MAVNSCEKYSFCVEWTTQIPFECIPRKSPNIILLEGVVCHLELAVRKEYYYLYIEPKKSEEWNVLNKFTVTIFIRDSSDSRPKLISYCQLNRQHSTVWYDKTLWAKSKGEVLAEIPNIFNIGKLTIICVFHSTDTQLNKKRSAHVSTQTALNSVDLQSLSRDFSTILKDKIFSDVKLNCAGCTFSANRSVLAARSEVFEAMFRNKMAETEAGEVDVKDTDPEVLELLLKYVYSAEIPDLCEETAHRLYEAADKYAVHGLRRACSDWMVECQTTDNCLDLLLLGDRHSDDNFKEAVACFVAEHLPDLSVESWSTFSDKYPLLAFAVLKKRCADSMPGAAKGAK